MGVDRGVVTHSPDVYERTNVMVSQNTRRQMCDQIVDISYDEEVLPTADAVGHVAPDNSRASKSKSEDATAQIRAVKPDVLVTQYGDRRTVTVSHNDYLLKSRIC